MIAQLKGILSYKSPEYIVIDVHGVGYGLFVTLNTFYKLPELGGETSLLTYTHVREDTLQLYGFLSEDEKLLFQQLIAISKIGPKLARNILSKLSVDDLKSAIVQADSGLINAIPGVGEKTAKRLILELKDKISFTDTPEPVFSLETSTGDKESLFSDAVSALINLGYPKNKAERAVRACLSSGESFRSLSSVIKCSLDLITK